ncbi:hypothetical protein THTE_3376 [Thermogutta terrifontis]|uniref:Uncharacterized protein n=1 Tax=Thermogutta terrifontis TaxID=1331910 RepID=A0A286RJ44_9BACT|nr:hypothetical protein THTE_3376 [Thermogutta terrifontis]
MRVKPMAWPLPEKVYGRFQVCCSEASRVQLCYLAREEFPRAIIQGF